VHYHYLTIEQRESLEKRIRAESRAKAQLEKALQQLHAPDYGVCIECRADIGFDRLQDDPWTLHCRACAQLPITR
jgi:RNA polymerase-binding transcription factor DksA